MDTENNLERLISNTPITVYLIGASGWEPSDIDNPGDTFDPIGFEYLIEAEAAITGISNDYQNISISILNDYDVTVANPFSEIDLLVRVNKGDRYVLELSKNEVQYIGYTNTIIEGGSQLDAPVQILFDIEKWIESHNNEESEDNTNQISDTLSNIQLR